MTSQRINESLVNIANCIRYYRENMKEDAEKMAIGSLIHALQFIAVSYPVIAPGIKEVIDAYQKKA